MIFWYLITAWKIFNLLLWCLTAILHSLKISISFESNQSVQYSTNVYLHCLNFIFILYNCRFTYLMFSLFFRYFILQLFFIVFLRHFDMSWWDRREYNFWKMELINTTFDKVQISECVTRCFVSHSPQFSPDETKCLQQYFLFHINARNQFWRTKESC